MMNLIYKKKCYSVVWFLWRLYTGMEQRNMDDDFKAM